MLQTLFIIILLFLLLTFIGIYLRKLFRNKPPNMQIQGEIFSDQPINFSHQVVKPDKQEKSNLKVKNNLKSSKTTVTISKNKKSKPSKEKLHELEEAFQFDADNENDNENDSIKNSSLTDKQQSINSKELEGFNFQQTSHNLQDLVTPTQGMCQEN